MRAASSRWSTKCSTGSRPKAPTSTAPTAPGSTPPTAGGCSRVQHPGRAGRPRRGEGPGRARPADGDDRRAACRERHRARGTGGALIPPGPSPPRGGASETRISPSNRHVEARCLPLRPSLSASSISRPPGRPRRARRVRDRVAGCRARCRRALGTPRRGRQPGWSIRAGRSRRSPRRSTISSTSRSPMRPSGTMSPAPCSIPGRAGWRSPRIARRPNSNSAPPL